MSRKIQKAASKSYRHASLHDIEAALADGRKILVRRLSGAWVPATRSVLARQVTYHRSLPAEVSRSFQWRTDLYKVEA